jgi:hypothetical protein
MNIKILNTDKLAYIRKVLLLILVLGLTIVIYNYNFIYSLYSDKILKIYTHNRNNDIAYFNDDYGSEIDSNFVFQDDQTPKGCSCPACCPVQ